MNNAAKAVKIIQATKGLGTPVLRVAAYCRVSSDASDHIDSFLAQMRHYNDYIQRNESMTLIDIYADEGISGTEMQKRDEFKRMLKDCKNGKIDRVLVKSVQRFARNSLECLEAVRALKSYGVSVYFENDRMDTASMNSEMMLYIKGAFAQGEAQSASKRMKLSVRMRMAEGTFNIAIAPYGYMLVDKVLIVNPQEAETIREIYRLYLSGYGVNKILRYLRGKEPKDAAWSLTGIRYILSNEKYAGDNLMQKKYKTTELPFRLRKNHGELPQYLIQGAHEGIVSREDFNRVQEIKKERENKYLKAKSGIKPFLYKRIKCRKCGWAYKGIATNGDIMWKCPKKGIAGTECHSWTYTDTEIRTAFVKMYNTLRQNSKAVVDETILQLQQLKVRANRGNSEIGEIDGEIAMLFEQNSVYTELFTSGVLDEVTYREKTDRYKREISELRGRRKKILNEDENEQCIEKLRELKRYLADSPVGITETSEEIFSDIVDKVFAEEDGALTFVLKCELELKVYVRR